VHYEKVAWKVGCFIALLQEQQGQAASPPSSEAGSTQGAAQVAQRAADALGVSLGPISLTYASDLKNVSLDEEPAASSSAGPEGQADDTPGSYASLSTAEWRELYEKDGAVDLWVQEEFNSGSRLVVSECNGTDMHGNGVRTAPAEDIGTDVVS
jgi:hypothetical protein